MIRAVAEQPDMVLAGAVDIVHTQEDAGTIAGVGQLGVPIEAGLEAALASRQPDVMVDFTQPAAVMGNVRCALARAVRCVVGTTGLSDEDLAEIRRLSEAHGVSAIVAPNFSLGAALMMRCAQLAAQHFDSAEIVELHHDQKKDAPSGTALRTAELMAAARGRPFDAAPTEHTKLDGARGGQRDGLAIHSIRLPGLLAHQSVVFGGVGETLTIRHDSISADSFMRGVLLAIRKSEELKGLVHGLELLLA